MQCAQCGAENAAGARFCVACGSPLGSVEPAVDPNATQPPEYGAPAAAGVGYPQPSGYAPQQPASQPGYPAAAPTGAPPTVPPPAAAPHKKRGCLVAALVVLVLTFGCVGAAFAATQLLKPKDLGVDYTEADYQSAVTKLGIQVVDNAPGLPPEKTKTIYRGKKKVNVKLTSREVSAAVSMHQRLPNTVLEDVQILLGDNGQATMSGYVVYGGQRYMFYSDITAQMAGPQSITGSAQQIIVFGVDFPREYYPAAERYLIDATNKWLAGMGEGLDIETATIDGGELTLIGTVPETVERVPLEGGA